MNNNAILVLITMIIALGLFVALFIFITNKTKYKSIISKVIVLIIIGVLFYKIYTGAFENIKLGILNGAVFLGLTWGAILAVWQRHIFNTIQVLFFSCLIGWLFSFGIACLEFGNIPFETSIRTATLIGLGLSAISTIFSSGELFSIDDSNYEDYTSGTTQTTHKKIKATTINYGKGLSETTYKDEDGNKTTIEHWKF